MKIAKFTVRGEQKAEKVLRSLKGISPTGFDSPSAHYAAPIDLAADYVVWQCKTDFEFSVPVPDDRIEDFKKIVGNIPFTFQGE